MGTPLRVLMVEDSEDDAELLERQLRRGGFEPACERVETEEAMRAALERQGWDLVVADYALPRFSAPAALALLRETGLDVPFIVVSGRIDEETAVTLMKGGAHDYLRKDNLARFLPAVRRERREADVRRQRRQAEEALQQREEEIRTITENVPALVSYVDAEGRYRFVNKQYEDWFGIPREQIVGTHYSEVLGGAAYERIRQRVEAVLAGQRVRYEDSLPYARGGPRWVVADYVPDTGDDGTVRGFFALVSDLTKRKQAEEALRESEERFRGIFENSMVGLYRTTPDGRILMANPALVRMLGYPSFEELARRNLEQEGYEPGCPRSAFKQLIEREGQVAGLESAWTRHDGTTVFVRESARLVRAEAGNTVCYEGTVEDITERKRAERLGRVQRELAVSLSAVSDLHEGLRVSLAAALDASRMDCGGIYLVDDSGALDLACHTGLSATFVRAVSHHPGESPNARLALAGKPVYSRHDQLGVTLGEAERREGLRAIAVVPVVHRGRVTACMNAASHRLGDVPHEARGALEAIAAQIGSAIGRLRAEHALRESEERFRQIAEHVEDAFWLGGPGTGDQRSVVYVSPAFERIFGVKAEAVLESDQAWLDAVHPADRENVLHTLETFLRDHAGYDLEYRIVRPDGATRWVRARASAICDEHGKLWRTAGVAQDITERKKAEEWLHLLSSMVEQSADAVLRTDTEFRITYMNEAAEALFGWTLDEMRGRTPDVFNADPASEQIQAEIYSTVSSGRVYFGEALNRRKDGSTFVCQFKVSPLRDAHGAIAGYMGSHRDVTDQRRAEEALRESEAKYRTLVEHLPAVTYIAALDEASTTLYVSPQIEAMIGFSPEQYAANPDTWRERLHPEDRERVLAEVARCRATAEPLASEYRMVARDGRAVWFRDEAAIVHDDAGNPLFLQGVMLDITQRKRLEREILEISDSERRRIGQELHDGLRQELVGTRFMAHALAQRLLARAAPEAEDADAIAKLLDETAQHTRDLASGMCPLAVVYADLLPALEQLAATAHDRFHVACDVACDALPDGISDTMATHLYHIAQEAVANAVRHGKAKHVEIAVATEGDAAALTVRDDGIGLPDELDGLRGLGLRIMRYRADVMGASLDVRRQPEGGTVVVCSIPATAREGERSKGHCETNG